MCDSGVTPRFSRFDGERVWGGLELDESMTDIDDDIRGVYHHYIVIQGVLHCIRL